MLILHSNTDVVALYDTKRSIHDMHHIYYFILLVDRNLFKQGSVFLISTATQNTIEDLISYQSL